VHAMRRGKLAQLAAVVASHLLHDTFTCRLLPLSVGDTSFLWLGAAPSSLCGAAPFPASRNR
jgi:hypothetical protein